MIGEDRAKLRSLYLAGPDRWAQADALAAAVGLPREDVLTGLDLARWMDDLQRGARERRPGTPILSLGQTWERAAGQCPAFSLAATRYLFPRDGKDVVSIAGDAIAHDQANGWCYVRGKVSLEGYFRETLALAAAALREEGHSPGLVARLEARLARGDLPSLGENLAKLTGDAGLAAAAGRGDLPGLLAALAAWPGLLRRPAEVLAAVGSRETAERLCFQELCEARAALAGGPFSALPRLPRLLRLLLHRDVLPGSTRPMFTRELSLPILDLLDPERWSAAERLLAALPQRRGSPGWLPEELALRDLLADQAEELAREGAAPAEAALIGALRCLARGEHGAALALAREVSPAAAERQRAALLEAVRDALWAPLGCFPAPA